MRTPLLSGALRTLLSRSFKKSRVPLFTIAAFAATSAHGQTFNTAAGQVTWSVFGTNNISEVTLVENGQSHHDGFDGAMRVLVDGANVSMTNEYHFSQTLGVAIQHIAVTNIGGTPTTFSLTSSGNLGSDDETYWHYSSNGTAKYTVSSDNWEANSSGSDPVISIFYGTGVLNAFNPILDIIEGFDYMSFNISNVPLAVGQTRRFLILAGVGNIDDNLGNTPVAANEAIQLLSNPDNWPSDFTNFLTASQKSEVMNWGPISTLPMTLKEFAATLSVGKVNLDWTTSNEQNTKDFTIQHSTDGTSWTAIGSVTAAGNSTTEKSYSFIHHTPATGINYYRLLQADLDGRTTLTPVRTIKTGATDKQLEVRGNPVTNGTLNIWVAEKGNATLVSATGKTVWQGPVVKGLNQVNVSQLTAGTYFLRTANSSAQVVISK